MKMKWCWRCQMNVPMLNDEEFKMASKLYSKTFRTPNAESNRKERFTDLLNFYNELTGWDETEPNAIMHHRINDFGADCPNCSKPLRTKRARYCAECGFGKDDFINQDTEPLMQRRRDLFNKE